VHPVEAARRKFRNSDDYVLLKRSLELRQSYLEFISFKVYPPEVVKPRGFRLSNHANAGGRWPR
jgi:hypothetical protein